jgi:hypothetical protein
MMIKGVVGHLAEGGKIKIGGLGESRQSSSGSTYRMPVKLDHFLVTSTARGPTGDLIIDEALMAALPKDADGKCRSIPVIVHDDDIERVFPTALALYGGKQLLCRGDGTASKRWDFDKDGHRTSAEPKDRQCPCPFLGAEKGLKCKAHGTLHCSIAVPGQAIAGAVHLWRTTSMISIQRMIGSIEQIRMACGTIRGLPLTLRVSPVTVSPNGRTSTVYVCHLELRAKDLMDAQNHALALADMRRKVAGELPAHFPIAAPAADDEDDLEAAEVAAEFYSDPDPVAPGQHSVAAVAVAIERAATKEPDVIDQKGTVVAPATPVAQPPPEPKPDPVVEKILGQIATIAPERGTDATLKWLLVRMGDSYPKSVRDAAEACRERIVAYQAARDPDPPPVSTPPAPADMPPWAQPEPGSRG